MPPTLITLRDSINKAYLRLKPARPAIEGFKKNLIILLDRINPQESEEFHKNLVISFLKETHFSGTQFINTKGRTDLVIHTGKEAATPVGVILEVKKPTNKAEMISRENLNAKAFQELVLYYLRERIKGNNLEIKHLIITNIHEWFVFDAHLFEKLFGSDKKLIQLFTDFEEGRLGGNKTDFFFNSVARPAIAAIEEKLAYTWFDIRDFDTVVRNADSSDDKKLIPLFKFFSPEHLLKLSFTNDSNSLDRRFYTELLHIIGLEETKDGGKKLIGRKEVSRRNPGSLLENAITILKSEDKLANLDKPGDFGTTEEDRLYQVGLELVITWINRILFLKLLEGQLVRYHRNDQSFRFLDSETLHDFDTLNKLFFQVLAVRNEDRSPLVNSRFAKIPYLNSSLFEPSFIERKTISISSLENEHYLPVLSSTVLKDATGKKFAGKMETLYYLFAFLDAYDFSSEGSEEIQEESKTLINASVLGLIFEKINGYKDGAFYTPGFITMFMCRESIRRAVVQKFNDAKGWKCADFTHLYNKIEDIPEANSIINSLKICDPAVGSGHFLVSALNEIIAIKHDLHVLTDRNGRRLKEYSIEVINDELVITDEENRFFEYRPGIPESQRVQEALFNEKRTIIENCLFGVDINPNSVKICRLRLWIELLKNAWYGKDGALETLPNIDINIKCGNSLISRYPLDADIKTALKGSKWTVESYRIAVMSYRNARTKEEKREMERLIGTIKSDFESEVADNDKRFLRRRRLRGELDTLTNQGSLWDKSKKEQDEWNKQVKKVQEEFAKLDQELLEIKSNAIFDNSFEWRFEFPEVLNENGEFIGFDVVIGNPPYIRQEELLPIKPWLKDNYETFAGMADLYVYFIERGNQILRQKGEFTFIVPNKWMRAGYGATLRNYLNQRHIMQLVDFGDLPVFEEATTYPSILALRNEPGQTNFPGCLIKTLDFPVSLSDYISENQFRMTVYASGSEGWIMNDNRTQQLLDKIRKQGVPLSEYVDGKIYYGIKTGLNEAFVIDTATRDRLIVEDPKSAEVIKPFLAGRDIKRYRQPVSDKYLIFARRGIEITQYPALLKHLEQYREQLEPRPLNFTGANWKGRKPGSYKWYEIQDAVDYWEEFEKPKIIVPCIVKAGSYSLDGKGIFSNDKTSIIVSDEKFLLALLNSRLIDLVLKQIASTKQGGYFEYKPMYFSQLPILLLEDLRKKQLNELVESLLNLDPGGSNESKNKI
ncbi:MAG: Eco57I restriction-modification methylase domain-containing protein, partial [Bacteroidia bacterium]|nr:Eco57I restriction-modification methylase domain-containing protein [Bacteroidia bacterium]